ncbi:MAG: hypothetical protein PHG80_11840 [Methanoregulaceae archaeon]|nr:hypothetical protein [Methanoregulaceae archaeon]
METSAQLNADFFVDDALTGLSPAGEAEDHGQETPPAGHQGLSFPPAVPTKLNRTLAQAPTGPTNQWDPRFLLDLAVGVDALPDILDRYGFTEDSFDTLSRSRIFRKELAQTIRDVRENGVSFTQKARIQAESYLEVIDQLVYDFNTPASTRLESIRSMVKWGRLEPKEDKEGAGTNAQQININISF